MKFAHELKEALRREGFPAHWIESAIPYGQLKKCIKKVEGELGALGLDAETLRHLVPACPGPEIEKIRQGSGDTAVAFQYQFAEGLKTFRPKLTLYIQLKDGVAIDASLSPGTRKYLEDLAAKQRLDPTSTRPAYEATSEDLQDALVKQHWRSQVVRTSSSPEMEQDPVIREVEVPLTFDAEFFGLLQDDVSTLDILQAGEQKAMTDEVRSLGNEVAKVTNPSKYRKSDLDRWRELFDIYLQAGIFFSTNEIDHGSRNSAVALKQLQWFQAEVMRKGLPNSFKLSASREVLNRFTSINLMLLRHLKFQEINQLAISKILKKFDKRTSLGAKNSFPKVIQSDRIMTETMAKAVCAEVSREIIKMVPQLDDYLCPICFSISYKPVRLACGHVFCIRCMIKMQKARDKFCPLCRDDVIMDADSGNLDTSLMSFLQKYFPKEVKVKQKENELALVHHLSGSRHLNDELICIVM